MIGIRKSGDVNSHLSNADLKVTDVVPGLQQRQTTLMCVTAQTGRGAAGGRSSVACRYYCVTTSGDQ